MSIQKEKKRGFTLIEIMVALTIFTLIMTMSLGSILSVFDANQKSKSLRSVMDNLNFSLESMTRTIRFGNSYHCDSSIAPISSPRDCAGGSSAMTLMSAEGIETTYLLSNNKIYRSFDGGATREAITSNDIVITKLDFRVFGSTIYPNTNQPQVIIVVEGYVGSKLTTRSSFSLQTTVSQRKIDI